MADKTDIKPFLDYLEREMGIMSNMAAACGALAAVATGGILTRPGSDGMTVDLWKDQPYLVIGAATMAAIAAASFALQRSHLAWFYGAAVESVYDEEGARPGPLVRKVTQSAACWGSYRVGGWSLGVSFAMYIATPLLVLAGQSPLVGAVGAIVAVTIAGVALAEARSRSDRAINGLDSAPRPAPHASPSVEEVAPGTDSKQTGEPVRHNDAAAVTGNSASAAAARPPDMK